MRHVIKAFEKILGDTHTQAGATWKEQNARYKSGKEEMRVRRLGRRLKHIKVRGNIHDSILRSR